MTVDEAEKTLLLQQLPAQAAIGGSRKAECFNPPALKTPNASMLVDEVWASAKPQRLRSEAF